jgi:general secretion pathway protein I
VLAVALGALIKVGSEGARTGAYLRERTFAHWTAMNVMAEYRAGLASLAEGTRRGSAAMARREWYWLARTQRVRPEVLGQRLDALWRVSVAVHADERREGEPLARLVGYLER